MNIAQAKHQLDRVLDKARVDWYKPIQVAEVLYHARTDAGIDTANLETYRNLSKAWRNEITQRLTGKRSSSSARYQDDLWNANAIPPSVLAVLDAENQRTGGQVEQYIYARYQASHSVLAQLMTLVKQGQAVPEHFAVADLLVAIEAEQITRRSIDKVYEIITYSLFDTLVSALQATIRVTLSPERRALAHEFAELVTQLLGIPPTQNSYTMPARIYRAGVTNAADRGLDMWANFGSAIQVKHIRLDKPKAEDIVHQVESDHIVIVCRDVDREMITTFLAQINWGQRVRGIITRNDLIGWYDRCLHGQHSELLAQPLLDRLSRAMVQEFPQFADTALATFLEERGYDTMPVDDFWKVTINEGRE